MRSTNGNDPDQAAVRAVKDEEVPVLVEVPGAFAPVHLEQDVLHRRVVVPHVVRGVLIVRLLLAGVRVDGHDTVGEQVVALADPAVEVGARVAGVEVQEVELLVERRRRPTVCAASRPRLALGRPRVASGFVGLGDHVAAPHALAGLELERVGVAAHPELSTGASDDDHVLDDERGDGRALAGPYVAVRLIPDELTGLRVKGDHVGVQGGHEDHPVGHGATAVDVAAAQRNVIRGRAVVAPQLRSRLGVKRPDPAVPAGHVHDAVDDERRRLERVGRGTRVHAHRAALEHPCGLQILDIRGVDLVEQAVALPVVGAVVRDPVVGLRFACLEDPVVVDAFRRIRRGADVAGAQVPEIDSLAYVDVISLSCHQLLLSTAAAGAGGRAWLRRGLHH